MTNQTARVLELLKRFNDGKKVCIHELIEEAKTQKETSLWWVVTDKKEQPINEKTIRRDLDVIKLVFPESFELIRGDKGCYKAITKKAFENFLTPETISMMAQVYNVAQKSNLFANIDLCDSDKRLLESQLKKSKDCYMFIDKPYENKKSDYQLFKEMENAIHHKQHLVVKYSVNDKTEVMDVKPYKILFINQNFYLVCEVVGSEYELTQLRVSNIIEAKMLSKQFYKNYEIEDFIKEIQTPFSNYKSGFRQYMVDIVVEVKKEKARFFKAKNALPSQLIVEQKPDGDLILSFRVTQELEIEELIKKWLPHIRVIKPLSLKEKIERELREYLLLDQ